MYTIYLLEGFNNYYNRRVIRYETKDEYLDHQTNNEKLFVSFEANFIPNDGVTTDLIVNAQKLSMDWNPDYILIVDSDNTIFQRWFVIDSVRTTMGQYRLSLKRDSFVDYYYEAINAPCLVEKATLTDDNPLIYNHENFVVNQIKQSETFLKDKTNSAWIVGYLNNGKLDMKQLDGGTAYPSTNPVRYNFDINAENVEGLTDVSNVYSHIGIGSQYCSINGSYPSASFILPSEINSISPVYRYFQTNFESAVLGPNVNSISLVYNGYGNITNALSNKFAWDFEFNDYPGLYLIKHGKENWQLTLENAKELTTDLSSQKDYINAIWGYANQDILANDSFQINKTKADLDALVGTEYYETSSGNKITITGVNSFQETVRYKVSNASALALINDMFVGNTSPLKKYFEEPYQAGTDVFYIGAKITRYFLSVSSENVGKIRYSLPIDIRTVNDNPYRMFCIPFNPTKYFIRSGQNNYVVNSLEDISFRVALDISKKLTGSGWLSDLQILPYCPAEYWCNHETKSGGKTVYSFNMNETTTDSLLENIDFTYIYDVKNINGSEDLTRYSFILFPKQSTNSFRIDCPIPVNEKKVENQCNFQRLCSPNYASSFQFNAVKNNGVDYFNVNMTCRPWNPFIQIYPNFKELYGNDFNDNRGLILAGDFSLPQVNDAWNTYEMNNKNYQAIFDRSIENMEKTHKVSMIESGTGVLAGAAAGAVMGSALPGVGTAVGAAIGAGVGLIGGAADMAIQQYRHNELIDYTKDQFAYNLQNIQALSNTITKTSALTANHKLFPFIEFYSCTDIEKEAFRNKLKWNGMTVGVISDVGIFPYIQEDESYIKAQIINIDIPDDAHIAQDIAKELYQGVRIKQ